MAVREIRTIGVVGAGIMGAGIAQRCAQGGYPVVFYNRSEAGLERGWRLIDGYQASLVTGGDLAPSAAREARERIEGTTDFAALAEVDFAFESIREGPRRQARALRAVGRPREPRRHPGDQYLGAVHHRHRRRDAPSGTRGRRALVESAPHRAAGGGSQGRAHPNGDL